MLFEYQIDKLKIISKKEGRSIASIIRKAVQKEIERYGM
jgi:predicted DNA-binding protein